MPDSKPTPPPQSQSADPTKPVKSADPAAHVEPAAATITEHNRTDINFRKFIPRPKVKGPVIDYHSHLFAGRHAKPWFEAAAHYGIDAFVSMTPLEEALVLQRMYPGKLHFIAIPTWSDPRPLDAWVDDYLRRIEAFYNLGSRIVKFHLAPGSMALRGWDMTSPELRKLIDEVVARDMIIMTHIGDPDTWYQHKYTDHAKFGTRDQHYADWEALLCTYKHRTWVGAHLGGNPEDPGRLQRLLDTYPNLYLDLSATRWMVREVSNHRDAVREFVIRNADRLLWGSDQVSGDTRDFDFLASRFWCHRKLWETGYTGPSPIIDPDVPMDQQPVMHGLALPDDVLQKIYHDNTTKLLGRFGMHFELDEPVRQAA